MYGDYLQAQGDPRGELIALDLLGGGPEVIARKNELLVTWIGDALLARILASGAIECGFVELYVDDDPELLDDVLASPAGPFLRTLTIRRRPAVLNRMASALCARGPRPWLAMLAIEQEGLASSPPTVPRAISDRLAAALPRLHTLAVTGARVFAALDLPQLKRLRVTGVDAIASLAGQGAAQLPQLEGIDLAFAVPSGSATMRLPAFDHLLVPARFPALVRLDLSRNEPGTVAPHNLGQDADVFGWLGELEVRAQLIEVKLPSVRTEAQAETLVRALEAMPALRRIEQVRGYALRDARFPVPPNVERVIAWPRPWLPPDVLGQQTFALVARPGEEPNVGHAYPLAHWLDEHAARLSEHALAAWGHVFTFLDQLGATEQPFPAVVMDTALASLGDGPGLAGWLRLRVQLRRGAQLSSPTVGIRRLP